MFYTLNKCKNIYTHNHIIINHNNNKNAMILSLLKTHIFEIRKVYFFFYQKIKKLFADDTLTVYLIN